MNSKTRPLYRLKPDICPDCGKAVKWSVRAVRTRQMCRVQYLECPKCGAHATRIVG